MKDRPLQNDPESENGTSGASGLLSAGKIWGNLILPF